MRPCLLFFVVLLSAMTGCGGDRHLPSLNPPEYDPKRMSPLPATASPQVTLPAHSSRPAEYERLRSTLDSLEAAGANGAGTKRPFDQQTLLPFQGLTNPCEVLATLLTGLGSAQLFAGQEGAALRKALGSEADGIARRMDEQLADGLKQSFGASAADCRVARRPPASGPLTRPAEPARLRLARTVPDHRPLFAQATIPAEPQEDYLVEDPPMRKEAAPPGWVGWKTTDSMTRVGNRPQTQGIYESYEMMIAPKARQCPHLEGPDREGTVDGTFEWSFVMYRRAAEQTILYRQQVIAQLKGKVTDEAQVDHVDFDVAVTLQHIGTELAASSRSYRTEGQFRIDQRVMGLPQDLRIITVSGFSEGEAEARDARLIAGLAALVSSFSGPEYYNAQQYWNHPNTCVELLFAPATNTQQFADGKSYEVKTELRTKKEHTVVPAKFRETRERPREGNGTVSPREQESQGATPVVFTYTAPSSRVRHSGFRVRAVSRAGVAEAKDGEWELAEGLLLEFTSHIVQGPLNLDVPGIGRQLSANGFDARVQATVPLQQMENRGWVGEGPMQFETRTTTQPAQCELRIQGAGTTTFAVKGGIIDLDPASFSVTLVVLPSPTGEVAETHCSSGQTPEKLKELFASQGVQGGEAHHTTKGGGWSAAFNVTRFTTFNRAKGGYEIGGWTPVHDGGVVARKILRIDCSLSPLQPCREVTEFTLKAAP
jgi:hypothetical protein